MYEKPPFYHKPFKPSPKMTKKNVRFLVILLLWESAWIESVTILFKETQEGKDIGRYDSGTNFKEIRA